MDKFVFSEAAQLETNKIKESSQVCMFEECDRHGIEFSLEIFTLGFTWP